ncbi:MAG: glycosyltransferase family 39 protein [Candidatus Gottesmanbacteria bacterium]|nr:glycosyltransferase family 39 protein [Candidatus Gottesmanbacteria bacterium]
MMKKSSHSNGFVLIIAGIVVAYFATRLINLTSFPIFTDEAIYIRWSQIGSRDAAWRFISLVDGKQPMYTWIAMGFMRFINDPILAGRLVSVFSGLGSLIAMFFLGRLLFKSVRVGVIASIFYVLSPFALVYDRMALYDSLVTMFSLWNLYLSVLLVTHLRLDIAMIFGITLGLGMLNKTSGFLSLYMVPITLFLFDWNKDGLRRRLGLWFLYIFIAALISQAMYSVLRLSPFFGVIDQKNAIFVYPFTEWLKHPTNFFLGNVRGLLDWLINYLTWPVWIIVLGAVFTVNKYGREKALLTAWWLAPFVALALFARVLYPRFIFFMTMPLLILAAAVTDGIIKKCGKTFFGILLIVCIIFPSIWTEYLLITKPIYAPIAQADRGQYMNDWPSGWGVREVKDFILQESTKGNVIVYTDGTFGLLPYGLEMYLVDLPNIEIHGIWPIPDKAPLEVIESVKKFPTYLVLNELEVAPKNWNLTLVARYNKGLRKDRSLRLYTVALPRPIP